MSHLERINKGERWRLVGENTELTSGDVVEVQIGKTWIQTRIEFSHSSKDYHSAVRGIYFYNGQPARIPEGDKWRKFK